MGRKDRPERCVCSSRGTPYWGRCYWSYWSWRTHSTEPSGWSRPVFASRTYTDMHSDPTLFPIKPKWVKHLRKHILHTFRNLKYLFQSILALNILNKAKSFPVASFLLYKVQSWVGNGLTRHLIHHILNILPEIGQI